MPGTVLAAELTAEYQTLAVIFGIALFAPLLVDVLSPRFRVPAVVLELGLGILVGPSLLAITSVDSTVDFLAQLGVAFLIFLAGYEIDVPRVKGTPLRLAATAWAGSLALGLTIGFVLFALGFALSGLVIGLCLTTTALGTLLPILRDDGMLETRFGTHVLAGGAVGEFAPIVAIALLLTTDSPVRSSAALGAFAGLAVVVLALALRARPPRFSQLLVRTLHSSGQMAVRLVVLAIVLLVWLASVLGLDMLLGAFLAGLVAKLFFQSFDEENRAQIEDKLDGVGFGFLIPLFFVVSGMKFDVDALFASTSNLLRVPLFVGLFLLVRGLPTWWVYRNELSDPLRKSLAVITSTALPLVVVITTIGLDTGRMKPENAASLVAAAMISVLVFPLVSNRMRRDAEGPAEATGPEPSPEPRSAAEPAG